MQRLTDDMKTALRAKDTVTLDSVRFIMSKVKNFEIDKPDHQPATEAEFHLIVKKLVKDSEEGVSMYKTGGRQDLVEAEQAKIAVYKAYLPQQMSEEAVRELAAKIVAENPGVAFGPLTGKVIQAAQGQTDGATVSRILRELNA